MKNYCAIPTRDSQYQVALIGPCGDFHPLGAVRQFSTFEEADEVARSIANGEYPEISPAGIYTNMR